MSRYDTESLYRLLPAVYRERDAAQGKPLWALVDVLAREARVVEGDVARLYESWFIETCDPWLVPYLGDLLGLRPTSAMLRSRRAEVANTIGYRRRKGTLSVLEQIAHDVTGWPARAVEYFERLATTQYLNHLRPHSLATASLRSAGELERLGGPFETATHTAEVRRIVGRRGRYNIPNVGIHLWRLQAFPLEKVMPRQRGASKRNFWLDPLGRDTPLFRLAQAEASATHVAEEANVPAPIRRRALHESVAAFYGTGLSIAVWTKWDPKQEPPPEPLPADQVVACDLTQWNRPRPADKVAIDPVLGRLSFPKDQNLAKVRVTYHHGFSADLGGGAYERAASFTALEGQVVYPVGEVATHPSLAAALAAWAAATPRVHGVIEVRDSRTYAETPAIALPQDVSLELRAANGQRPCLVLTGDLVVTGEPGSSFEVNGLLIAGGRLRVDGDVDGLAVRHSTLMAGPAGGPAGLVISAADTEAAIVRSIVGPIASLATTEIAIEDSIVDAGGATAEACFGVDNGAPQPGNFGGALRVFRSTLIGIVRARRLALAENSLFTGRVEVDFRQDGCVRFCSLPRESRVPRRYRCQPALPDGLTPAQTEEVVARLTPRFTSLAFGDPAYCQLALSTADEVRRGAEDGSEMGVFSRLGQPLIEASLRVRLAEYLRVGLEAELFFET